MSTNYLITDARLRDYDPSINTRLLFARVHGPDGVREVVIEPLWSSGTRAMRLDDTRVAAINAYKDIIDIEKSKAPEQALVNRLNGEVTL